MMVKLGVSAGAGQGRGWLHRPRRVRRPTPAWWQCGRRAPWCRSGEDFDRAWRRVGLALDRTGFTVEDRDRSKGLYFVRYVAPKGDKKEPGFLGKLMSFASSEKAVPPLKYRIVVRSQGEATTVSVLNAAGAPESSANAESIVRVLAEDLK
jgi:outer membrane protein assembly factor BamC